jgi:hypothetical protein
VIEHLRNAPGGHSNYPQHEVCPQDSNGDAATAQRRYYSYDGLTLNDRFFEEARLTFRCICIQSQLTNIIFAGDQAHLPFIDFGYK